jgi:DNA polymerase
MNQSSVPHDELRMLASQLRNYLDALRMWGVQHVPIDRLSITACPEVDAGLTHHLRESSQEPGDTDARSVRPAAHQETEEIPFASQLSADPLSRFSFPELEAVAKRCTQCRLHRGRTHVVFGVGNPQADLMFVGEAPGRDEDLQGEPFVGRAGQLLTRIIEAIGMKRQDVYIANVIKCRPPNNRNPEADEIARCEPYLIRQIALVKPRLIVALGTFAAQTLLKTKLPISQIRGRFHTYQGVRVMPTFHPAFLLRNPERKRAVWEDMQLVQRELGHPPA